MPKREIKKGISEYFKEPAYNLSGIFVDYLPVPLRWAIALIICGLILYFAGFWGFVKFIIGLFWVGTIFFLVSLIYQIVKDKRQRGKT